MKKSLIIQQDNREKLPLVFPETLELYDGDTRRIVPVQVEEIRLPAGDYRLKDCPDGCIIERKGSPLELARNMFDAKDRQRFARAMHRLVSSCRIPILLLAFPLYDLFTNGSEDLPPVSLYIDRLCRLCSEMNLRLIICGQSPSLVGRRIVGSLAAHILVSMNNWRLHNA